MAVRISILTTCHVIMYMYVLTHARDCDVRINHFCPVGEFRKRSAIFFKVYHTIGLKLVSANIILYTFFKCIIKIFGRVV